MEDSQSSRILESRWRRVVAGGGDAQAGDLDSMLPYEQSTSDATSMPRTRSVHSCPACDSRESTPAFTGSDRVHNTPGMFSYRCCSDCRTVYQDPCVIPEDLHLCYPLTYHRHSTEGCRSADLRARPPASRLQGWRQAVQRAVIDAVLHRPHAGFQGKLGKIAASSRRIRVRAFHGAVPMRCYPLLRRQEGHWT